MSDHDPNEETIASLLHTIALIREAAGCEGVMLGDLPREIAALKAQRDEAQREVCEYEAKEKQLVYDDFVGRYLSNTPQRVAYRRGWNCFDAKEGQR